MVMVFSASCENQVEALNQLVVMNGWSGLTPCE